MTALVVALTSHLFPDPISPALWRTLRPFLGSEGLGDWATKNLSPADAARVLARLELVGQAEQELGVLAEQGIVAITELDETYPQPWKDRLSGKHPPVLFAAGSPGLLAATMIGVVGSREVDADGSAFAQAVSQGALEAGYGVVSGGARGVDQVAMRAAFEAGGTSVGILADSLVKAVRQSADTLESSRVCLCTPFSPHASFSVGTAMARNRLIYALSTATVVVASSDGTGGTWSGAVDAIDNDLCPVFVRDVPLAGNQKLIAKGGHPIADPSDLKEMVDTSQRRQTSLF